MPIENGNIAETFVGVRSIWVGLQAERVLSSQPGQYRKIGQGPRLEFVPRPTLDREVKSGRNDGFEIQGSDKPLMEIIRKFVAVPCFQRINMAPQPLVPAGLVAPAKFYTLRELFLALNFSLPGRE